MKEYICIRDFFIEDIKFANKGDKVALFNDNTIVNMKRGNKRAIQTPEIVENKEYFTPAKTTLVKEDKVNHPSHYTWLKERCGIEVIDITRHLDFDTGNAVKYLLRAGHKSEEGMTDKEKTIQDLEKAVWYIQDKIKMLTDGNKLQL